MRNEIYRNSYYITAAKMIKTLSLPKIQN